MVSTEIVYQDIESKYSDRDFDNRYARLYESENPHLRSAFGYFHDRLNDLLKFMNQKKLRGGHYNAEQSRELIDITREIGLLRTTLSRIGVVVSLAAEYEETLERCRVFLNNSGGSAIPEDFVEFAIEDYEPIFSIPANTVRISKTGKDYALRALGLVPMRKFTSTKMMNTACMLL
ncbi:hypothetical protein NHF46_00220 [Arthrobacter alpinus]|nr:hypothetical protein [Arthrobacter alpinus]